MRAGKMDIVAGERHNRIRIDVEPELRDLVPVYIANRLRDVEMVRAAVEGGDFESVGRIAHNMQGSGGSFGFDDLTAVGVELERAAQDRNRSEIARLLLRLEAYLSSIDLVVPEPDNAAAGAGRLAMDATAAGVTVGEREQTDADAEILLVDDQEMNAVIMRRYLVREGYEVRWLPSGSEALTALEGRPLPSLILLDVIMAGMNGFEVCRRIKSSSVTCAIPVMLVTSFDRRSEILQGWAAGADDVLSKPVRRDELVKRVRWLLLHSRKAGRQEAGGPPSRA